MPFTLVTNQTIIARNAGTLYGVAVGNSNMASYVSQAGTNPDAFLNLVYTNSVGTASPAAVAAQLLIGLGMPAVTVPPTAGSASQIATDYIVAQLTPVAYTARGAVVNQILNLFSGLTADPVFGTFATAWNTQVTNAVTYASVSGNADTTVGSISTTPSTTGSTFTFTTGADNFTGSANGDTFNGVVGTGATFSNADVINGGSGVDTLSLITDNAALTLIGTNLTSIEKIQVNATAATPVVTFSNVVGVTEVVNNASSSALTFGTVAANAGTVNNVVALTINGATANTILSYSDTALTGSADTQVLNLNGTGTATSLQGVTIRQNTGAPVANQLETLTINTTGTNGITLATDGAQTSLKTMNIAGTGNLSLALTADNTVTNNLAITSTSTGNVVIGGDGGVGSAAAVTLGVANDNVVLGAGNDSIYFGANLNSSDTVDGGSGIDTLGVSAAVTNAIMTNVKNIEVIRFDTSAASITQDAGITSLAGDNFVDYAAAGAKTLTLNNLANNLTTTFLGGASTAVLTEVLKDGSGLSDTQTVVISNGASNAAATLGTLTNIAGLETLNLVSNGGTGTNVITNDNVTAKQVITGSAGLTITNALASTAIDASAFTGKLTATTGNTATNIIGGTANDTITGGTGADTISGGSGNDTIANVAAGTASAADVLAGGAGNDIFNLRGTTGSAATYGGSSVITDFTVGTSTGSTDVLQLNSGAGMYAAGQLKTIATGAVANIATTALGSVNVLNEAVNAATALTATTTGFIKLTTATAFTTDLQTTFNNAIGTGTITGAGADSFVAGSFFDSTNNKAVIFVVDSSTSTANTINSGDAVTLIGTINMTAADYANFGVNNISFA